MLAAYIRVSPADHIACGELKPLRDPQNADNDGPIELSVPLLPEPQMYKFVKRRLSFD
jgi:hypothetical protein